MALQFIASVQGYNSAVGTTIDCSSALNVQAGDLLVAWVEWQNAETANTFTVDENDGTDTFTNGSKLVINDDIGGGFAYLIDAPADASFTPRATISASSRRIEMIVLQFRPDSGDTVTMDAEGTITSGSGASMASNNISTTGTDEVVIGAASNTNGGTAFSSEQIGGSAADGSVDGTGVFMGIWYTIYSATQSNINATATGAAEDWVINIISFKSEAGGGGDVNVDAGVDALTLTEYSPNINAAINVQAGVANLALSEYAANVNAATNVQAAVDALTLTPLQATVTAGVEIQAAVANLALTEYAASINAAINVAAGLDALTLTAYPATVKISGGAILGRKSPFVARARMARMR